MNDFYGNIKKHLENEYHDFVEYTELADKANDSGEAQILKDIANEKYLHAKHLKYILEKAGIEDFSEKN